MERLDGQAEECKRRPLGQIGRRRRQLLSLVLHALLRRVCGGRLRNLSRCHLVCWLVLLVLLGEPRAHSASRSPRRPLLCLLRRHARAAAQCCDYAAATCRYSTHTYVQITKPHREVSGGASLSEIAKNGNCEYSCKSVYEYVLTPHSGLLTPPRAAALTAVALWSASLGRCSSARCTARSRGTLRTWI